MEYLRRDLTCKDFNFVNFEKQKTQFIDFCKLRNIDVQRSKQCSECGCGSNYHAVTNENSLKFNNQPYCRQNFKDNEGLGCENYKKECSAIMRNGHADISVIDPFRKHGANEETALVCKECGCNKPGKIVHKDQALIIKI